MSERRVVAVHWVWENGDHVRYAIDDRGCEWRKSSADSEWVFVGRAIPFPVPRFLGPL